MIVSGRSGATTNDIAQWHYLKLPEALGCDGWFTARATTCDELDSAIKDAEVCGTGAYIEVVTDKYAAATEKKTPSVVNKYANHAIYRDELLEAVIENTNHVFQPDDRFWAANSQ